MSYLTLLTAHRDWAARLATVAADRGFAVLTGEAGVGQSTARRAAWNTWSPNPCLPLYGAASDDGRSRSSYRQLAHGPGCPATRCPEATE
ncbi:MAG: hypothetical protein M0Z54_11250 [Thermaerobacter sp.]|nr:hypothetical protein [Thermaerobacter sp.]